MRDRKTVTEKQKKKKQKEEKNRKTEEKQKNRKKTEKQKNRKKTEKRRIKQKEKEQLRRSLIAPPELKREKDRMKDGETVSEKQEKKRKIER